MSEFSELRIGVSVCFFHADPDRPIFTGKTLQYAEQSTPNWIASQGALPVLIPSTPQAADLARYADWLDALVLEGGSDMWPGHYGETALKPQWNGDQIRDQYEIALTREFVKRGKPVFGICRGLQVLNVAFGGSLFQDIASLVPGAARHRDADTYDQNFHQTELLTGSALAGLYPDQRFVTTNSVHHQAIKTLAPDFVVEARCVDDGIIEAIRWEGPSYVRAVQWHPEFHLTTRAAGLPAGTPTGLIDDTALLQDFLRQALTYANATA